MGTTCTRAGRGAAASGDGRASRERGSALPLVAGLMGMCVAAMVMVTEVGRLAAEHARAQAAADMAALGGLFEGERGARQLAQVNGAELLVFSEGHDTVLVVVVVGRSEARASARYEWAPPG